MLGRKRLKERSKIPTTSGVNLMQATYRGIKYDTSKKEGQKLSKSLTYRGNEYVSATSGSCHKETYQGLYRGSKFQRIKTVCD